MALISICGALATLPIPRDDERELEDVEDFFALVDLVLLRARGFLVGQEDFIVFFGDFFAGIGEGKAKYMYRVYLYTKRLQLIGNTHLKTPHIMQGVFVLYYDALVCRLVQETIHSWSK